MKPRRRLDALSYAAWEAAAGSVLECVRAPAPGGSRWVLPSAPAGRVGGGGHCGDRLGTGRVYFCADRRFWCPLLAISNGEFTPASARWVRAEWRSCGSSSGSKPSPSPRYSPDISEYGYTTPVCRSTSPKRTSSLPSSRSANSSRSTGSARRAASSASSLATPRGYGPSCCGPGPRVADQPPAAAGADDGAAVPVEDAAVNRAADTSAADTGCPRGRRGGGHH